jgi:hypothetical protein
MGVYRRHIQAVSVKFLCKAKVDKLCNNIGPFPKNEAVVIFDVAVQDAMLLKIRQRRKQALHNAVNELNRNLLSVLGTIAQVHPQRLAAVLLHEIHRGALVIRRAVW